MQAIKLKELNHFQLLGRSGLRVSPCVLVRTVVSHLSAANIAGEAIEANVMNYFRFQNGKISYMANFHDTKPFAPVTN